MVSLLELSGKERPGGRCTVVQRGVRIMNRHSHASIAGPARHGLGAVVRTAVLDQRRAVEQIDRAVDLACQLLPTMQNDNGLFCFDRRRGETGRRGESLRYSIITLLGLQRLQQTEGVAPVDPVALRATIRAREGELGVGDLGLLLWSDTRTDNEARTADTLAQLQQRVEATDIDRLEGMEIAWWVIGATKAVAAGHPAHETQDLAVDHLMRRRSAQSALFHHLGTGQRAALPNFATEIYALLALAYLIQDDRYDFAETWATSLADTLIALRLPDGGWPWLYHADRGVVIEPYEVYSVHQDAMAPMALSALAEATGHVGYRDAGVEGLSWCYGNNELGAAMIHGEEPFIDRSIRRTRAGNRLSLAANVALGGIAGVAHRVDLGRVEINETCRPYHLGWILEAWAGRRDPVDAPVEPLR